MIKAKITEIFSSIQGEGLYVGEEQTFVRFYGCNLGCKFCDENKKSAFREYTPSEVVENIIMEKGRTISLTGGEPLLYSDFLKEVLPILKKMNLKIYLETNGILKNRLLEILDYVDVISMDFKLPSSTGIRSYWQEHSMFLEEAIKKEVFVKSVVTGQTLLSDIEMATSLIKTIDRDIPFIIQPVSYNGSVEKVDLLSVFFQQAKELLSDVRIIPQVHKIIGVQ